MLTGIITLTSVAIALGLVILVIIFVLIKLRKHDWCLIGLDQNIKELDETTVKIKSNITINKKEQYYYSEAIGKWLVISSPKHLKFLKNNFNVNYYGDVKRINFSNK